MVVCKMMACAALVAGTLFAEEVEFSLDGRVAFRDGTGLYVVSGVPTGGRYIQAEKTIPDSEALTSRIVSPGNAEGTVSLSVCSNGFRYAARVNCKSKAGEKTGGCGFALLLPQSAWNGCCWRADGGEYGSKGGN